MKVNLGSGMCPIPGYLNCDIHPMALEKARQLNMNFMEVDVKESLPWDDESLDEVRCENLFDSLTRPEFNTLLREIYRVLKPGCKLHFHQGDVAVNPDMCIGWPGFVSGYTRFLFDYYTLGHPAWARWHEYYDLPGFAAVNIEHNESGIMIGQMTKP